MHLHDFQHSMDKDILQRGTDYYYKGHVLELEEKAPFQWHAAVEGSSFYKIRVDLKAVEGDRFQILEANCDCPYDWGRICKHSVAVLIAIGEQYEKRAFAKESGLPQNTSGISTYKAWLERHAAALKKDDLMEFLGEYGKWNAEFRKAFQEWVYSKKT